MASFVWAKMWIETLDDYKLGLLDDHLWRRFFEFVLLAKECDAGGYLPKLPAMAWRLRTTPQEIEADLQALAVDDLELLTLDDHGWRVTNFVKRQETAMDSAERKRRQRDRERHEQYADTSPDCHAPVTPCDIDVEERRGEDKEVDVDVDANVTAPGTPTPAEVVFLEVFGPFAYEQDRKDILAVETQVGAEVAEQVIRWAKRKRIASECVIQSIVTAAGKWSMPTGPPGDNGRGDRSSNATLDAIRELEAEVNGGFG